VAWTDEVLSLIDPVIRATQVRALRRERDDILGVVFHHPGGCFFADHAPAVDARAAKHNFFRLLRLELIQMSGFHPLAGLLGFGTDQQIQRSWNRKCRCNYCSQTLNRNSIKTTTINLK
jgi:hypothetical protein